MKKLMYLAVFTLALGFTACGSDDDGDNNCFNCSVAGFSVDVCRGENGNAFINGEDSGTPYDEAVAQGCDIQIGL